MRAHVEGADLVFEDPTTIDTWRVFADGSAVMFHSENGNSMWIRASDAAAIGDWLRRTFASQDWRHGVDPEHTSIPQNDDRR